MIPISPPEVFAVVDKVNSAESHFGEGVPVFDLNCRLVNVRIIRVGPPSVRLLFDHDKLLGLASGFGCEFVEAAFCKIRAEDSTPANCQVTTAAEMCVAAS